MKLTIVYDNQIYKKRIGLKSDWGFSCLIETKNKTILFDTGSKGDILLNNMEKLRINPKVIDKIVISHEHGDHNGGLKSLSTLIGDVELYRLAKSNTSENVHLKSVEEPLMIAEEVYTTGRIKGWLNEQSLVLKSEKGWYLLVGCSHPGVEKILNAAKKYGDVLGIVGGLHGFNNFPILKDLDFICPCHCTQHNKTLKELYPNTYELCGVGKVIEI